MKGKKRWLAFAAILLAAAAALPVKGATETTTTWINRGGVPTVIGNRDIVSRERPAQGFAALTLQGSGNVRVHLGEAHRVVVTTDSNIQEHLGVETRGDSLHIGFSGGGSFSPSEVTIDVYMPELRGVRLEGSGSVSAGAISAPSLDVTINGSGRVTVAGSVASLEAAVNGSGSLSAENLRAGEASVAVNGSGRATVWATDSLRARQNGSGVIAYRGNPAALDVRNSGSGRIRRL